LFKTYGLFGEDPKSTSGEDFFGVFSGFLNSFAVSITLFSISTVNKNIY